MILLLKNNQTSSVLEGRNTRPPPWGQSNARSLEDALTAVPISWGAMYTPWKVDGDHSPLLFATFSGVAPSTFQVVNRSKLTWSQLEIGDGFFFEISIEVNDFHPEN